MIALRNFIHRAHTPSTDAGLTQSHLSLANSPITHEFIGGVTIFKLAADAPIAKQCRALLRTLKKIPMDRRQVVLDISAVQDDDPGLPALVSRFISRAHQCRLDACVAGLSATKEAFFELTRVSQFVPCFHRRYDAICHLLMSVSVRD